MRNRTRKYVKSEDNDMKRFRKEISFVMVVVILLTLLPAPEVGKNQLPAGVLAVANTASAAGTGQAVSTATSQDASQLEDKDLVTGATTITVNKEKLVLGVGETFQLKASVVSEDEVDSALNFFTYFSRITVTKKGKITANATGKASVVVEASNGVIQVVWVTVKKAPKKISLYAKTKTVKKGKTFQIKTKLPKNTASNTISYTSSRKKVAAVSSAGKVTARKKGRTVVTVKTYNGKKAKITIVVN